LGNGFSVTPGVLQAGSQDMAGLQSECLSISRNVVAALSSMAGSAGHAGLEGALNAAAGRGNQAYTSMWAAYGHTSESLAASAQNYSSTDTGTANRIRSLVPGFFGGGPQP
jgi:Excreted virulence factor EspC, type VII ESX diderm